MAQNLEREMFDEHDEDESMTDDVVFHVSTDPIVVEEMDFLIELMTGSTVIWIAFRSDRFITNRPKQTGFHENPQKLRGPQRVIV